MRGDRARVQSRVRPGAAELTDLDRDGFLVAPFLDAAELDALRAAVLPLVPAGDATLFSPHRQDAVAHRALVSATVLAVLAGPARRLLPGHRPLMAGLFIKRPGAEGRIPLHQDWTYVDEARFRSGTIWVPLVDSGRANGGLHAVAGSHRLGRTYRGSPTYVQAVEPIREQLESGYLTPLDAAAGDAVVFDHRVLHGSFANTTDEGRVAVVIGWAPDDAEILHIWRDEHGGKVEYIIDPAFLVVQDPGCEPGGHLVGRRRPIDEPEVLYGAAELAQLRPLGRVSGGS